MFAKFKKDVDSQLSLFSSSAVQSELDVIKLFRFSDICAKRHLRERHLRERHLREQHLREQHLRERHLRE
jgi:hypothetical protein